MPDTNETNTKRIRILQINLNKSSSAHLDILNNTFSGQWDIVLLQEPHITHFGNSRTPSAFHLISPTSRATLDTPLRSIIWISSRMKTSSWKTINVPGSNNITAVQISGAFGCVSIFNIYNDGNHNDTLTTLTDYMTTNKSSLYDNDNDFILWCGDFNRHHPSWDSDEDERLFTPNTLRNADILINHLANWNMVMALPKGIPTLEHMVTKRYSRPDNVFCTENLSDYITNCDVLPQARPTNTDHFPITTTLNLPTARILPKPSHNFKLTDWKDFNLDLLDNLLDIPFPTQITTPAQLQTATTDLTSAIQKTILSTVPINKPCAQSKRWWNSDLKEMKKDLNRLSSRCFRYRAVPTDPIHEELRAA